jgi:hypothetical protein
VCSVFGARAPAGVAGAGGWGGRVGGLAGRRLVVYSVLCAVWLVLSFLLGTHVRAFLARRVAVVSAFMASSSSAVEGLSWS